MQLEPATGVWLTLSEAPFALPVGFSSASGTFTLLRLQGRDFLSALHHVLSSAREGHSPSWLFSPLPVYAAHEIPLNASKTGAGTG